jgi:hypothetical protein
MYKKPFVWTIERTEDGKTDVSFNGDLDERCNLEEFPALEGEVTFDLGGVTRVTSGGVTRWIKLLRSLQAVTQLSFVRCSVPVVTQLNMVRGFQGHGLVRSFYAPYVCEATGEEEDVLLTPDQVTDLSSAPTFSTDDGEIMLNDLPRRYFAFLFGSKS